MKNITLTALFCLFTVALSAQKSTFKVPDSCVVANTRGQCWQCGNYYIERKKLPEALAFLEKAYSFDYKRDILKSIFNLHQQLEIPFDADRYLLQNNYDDLLYDAIGMGMDGLFELAVAICKRAIKIKPDIKAKILLVDYSQQGNLPFDLSLITTDLTSPKDMTMAGNYFLRQSQYYLASTMYKRSYEISPAADNIIGLYIISRREKAPFDMNLFLKSQNGLELREYAQFFSRQSDSQKLKKDKIPNQRQAVLMLESAVILPGGEKHKPLLARFYSDLSFYLLFDHKPKEAIEIATKALDIAPEFDFAYTNIALALLLEGKYEEAEKLYLKWMNQTITKGMVPIKSVGSITPSTFREAFLLDLKELEKDGITHPDFSKIRALLEAK